MNPDPGAAEADSSLESPGGLEPAQSPDHEIQDLVPTWAPSGKRLISGLLGLNLVLLGSALVAGGAFNPDGLKHQEPQVFMLLLMGVSLVWMLWYLLWARRQPGICPHKDHHAGGVPVTVVLMLFAAFSLLLCVFRAGYLLSVMACKPAPKVLSPFFEAPFLALQTYLLWAHSKDCIHRHKTATRSGLMLVLSADLLLWLNAVTEETVHEEMELERDDGLHPANASQLGGAGVMNSTSCRCSASAACLVFRKGFEVLYPFNMEFYLMAGCMLYVMWKNVGRGVSPAHPPHATQKLTLQVVYRGGVPYGLAAGALVLAVGVVVFILYQVWVGRRRLRHAAFLLFYGYHLAVMPAMALCCVAGVLVHRLERRASEAGRNPTRSLDVTLLVAAALGQLALSYFSVVAAMAVGTGRPLGDLDLAYSLLSLLEILLQNIFIIEGLHRHPSRLAARKERRRSSIFKIKKKTPAPGERTTNKTLLDGNAPAAAAREHDGKNPWTKRAIQEICAFLILSNVMLWVIPAFGVHPQFENGLGKQFFGFSAWFVLVNLGQPLSVFYRMHSVGALMELLIAA
ncbi:proton channel OTOP3-like [Pseudoliparis swirei]|uniref:proton channel OTOP3-like n=1 Tax=Pseudoliparis swirei TaxID=2059687 RepID=UPI0024BEC637|nr:proton channel OTOP3-like [Pseudoliparis swirei]